MSRSGAGGPQITVMRGRVIKAGRAAGQALVSAVPIGFLGGVDPDSGIVLEPGHPLQGRSVSGKVLVFPTGKGSTVGSYTILRLARSGHAPAAIVNSQSEAIVAVGAIIADIPMVDQVDISRIQDGDWVTVEDGVITVEHRPPGQRPATTAAGDAHPGLAFGVPDTLSDPSEARSELIFLKLGGSLLTDKSRPRALRADVLRRLAGEIAEALSLRPGLRLLIGHGGGSYAHVVASQYGTRSGVSSPADWHGYAATARAASELNHIVVEALADAGLPVLPVQPSASALCRDGELRALDDRPLRAALEHGLVPVVHGDVALDEVRGGTVISTEEIFRWLAPRLHPQRVLLVGEVAGVLTVDPAYGEGGQVIPEITQQNLPELAQALGGARGTDVTGGMLAKVTQMLELLETTPVLAEVQVVSGLVPGLVRSCLADPQVRTGTRITRSVQ